MQQTYTIVDNEASNPFRCALRTVDLIETHAHTFFELDMILTGTCQVSVGTDVFTASADDVFSIEAETPHSFIGNGCTLITVQFDQSFFERTLPIPRHPNFVCNSALQGNDPAFDRLRQLIARLIKNNASRELGYELRNWQMIYELMDIMYQNFRVEASETRHQKAHRYASRIIEINRIISENYRDNLTLTELSDRIHLSAPYLSKFFEKQFGETFLNYLTRIRLNHALESLLKTDDTIENISADAGFPNSHAFVQAFRREYGVLPSVYRRRFRSPEAKEDALLSVEQHDYMAGLKKYLDQPQVKIPRQAVSAWATVKSGKRNAILKHTWKEVLAVTTASAVLTADIQALLRRVQQEIGFRYLKFNGLLSDDMHVYYEKADGTSEYDFLYVDKVFDFLLSLGLRPFIQLSFMPSLLARTDHRLFGYLVSEPESLYKWHDLVRHLTMHLLERYGEDEVRKWHFSVWHQPDSSPSMYGFSDNEAFYRFYRSTCEAVKGIDPLLSFGAPSTYYFMQDGYTNWYIPFLAWCRDQKCMPDFLNFHFYDLIPENAERGQEAFGFTRSMVLRETSDGFGRFVGQVLNERKRVGAASLPVYLTEWNNTPSQQDLLNDTCFKSCYIAKCILENYDKLNSFGYWSLSDWMGEAPQPRELYFGGLGLFTVNNIPKASYYVFELLRHLGDTLLDSGEGWFVTRQEKEYRIIVYNYRHFSRLYAMGEFFDMTFTDRYTPFSPEQMLDIHLSIQDVPDGSYMITETVVNRNSGSSFDQWIAMGAVELTGAHELNTLSSRSVPAINKYIVQADDHALHLDAMLDMLEVRLITVSPIPDSR